MRETAGRAPEHHIDSETRQTIQAFSERLAHLHDEKNKSSTTNDANKSEIELTDEERLCIQVMHALPPDPIERMIILDSLHTEARELLDESTQSALRACNNCMDKVNVKLGQSWRNWVKYPHCLSFKARSKLDEISRLVDLPEKYKSYDDRYTKMTVLLEQAEKSGFITSEMHHLLRSEIGPNM